MLQTLKNYLKAKVKPILILSIGVVIYLSAYLYLQRVCSVAGCEEAFRTGFIKPMISIGIMLILLTIPFLFLKQDFFIAWLKWLAGPIVVVTTYAVLSTAATPLGTFSPYRADVVETLTWLWVLLTLLFIVVHWYRSSK